VSMPEEWEIDEETDHIESKYYTYAYDRSHSGRKMTIRNQYKTLSDHIPAEAMNEFIRDHETMRGNMTYYLTYDTSPSSDTPPYIPIIVLGVATLAIVFRKKLRRR
jgi:hypothetical protein